MTRSMKDMIGLLSVMAGERATNRKARGMLAGAARLLSGSKAALTDTLAGINAVGRFVEEEAARWRDPEDIPGLNGQDMAVDAGPVPFDACDLRVWVALAERAGVPAIPAVPLMSLHKDVLSLTDRPLRDVDVSMKRLRDRAAALAPETAVTPEDLAADPDLAAVFKPATYGIDRKLTADETASLRAAAVNALFDAMDDVPESWMVRTHISGSSTLKALAGAGVLGRPQEGAKIGNGIEIGAGWVRVGNRRRIDAHDTRFVETFARGHKPVLHYLARPWQIPSRMIEGDDPHRHGTQFAGKGAWPAEWRVFVENGEVKGVANYYGWCGEADAQSARGALAAADNARLIVAEAKALGLASRFMDIMLLTMQPSARETPEALALRTRLLDRFDIDGLNCTLDFMETADGLKLVEGGPAFSPIGGAHPCAFAGVGIAPGSRELDCDISGVALKMMPHVLMADTSTWVDGDRTGCILTWDAARELADTSPAPGM